MSVRVTGVTPNCCTPAGCLNKPPFQWIQHLVGTGASISVGGKVVYLASAAGGAPLVDDPNASVDPSKDFCMTFRVKRDSGTTAIAVGLGQILSSFSIAQFIYITQTSGVFSLVWNGGGSSSTFPTSLGANNSSNLFKICKQGSKVRVFINGTRVLEETVDGNYPTAKLIPFMLVNLGGVSTAELSEFCVEYV